MQRRSQTRSDFNSFSFGSFFLRPDAFQCVPTLCFLSLKNCSDPPGCMDDFQSRRWITCLLIPPFKDSQILLASKKWKRKAETKSKYLPLPKFQICVCCGNMLKRTVNSQEKRFKIQLWMRFLQFLGFFELSQACWPIDLNGDTHIGERKFHSLALESPNARKRWCR